MSRKIQQRLINIAADISPMLAAAIEQAGPVRLSRWRELPLTVFLCRTVAGQQLSTKAAAAIWNRVLESAGEMPLHDYLIENNTDTLRACGLSGAKVKAIRAIVEAEQNKLFDHNALKQLHQHERVDILTQIWGVGQWTVDMLGIFYFNDPDIWPEGDLAARKTLAQLTSRRRKTQLTAARFAPYRSYLAIYMWAIADVAIKK